MKVDKPPVFVEATEWGEVLALSGADYLQGTEAVEGEPKGDDTCGQSIVYDFIQELHSDRVAQTDPPGDPTRLGLGDYQDKPNAWPLIWTYRRVRGEGEPAPGDLCLQNWGYSEQRGQGGNDYPFGYLFKSKAEAAQETSDWQGGVDLSVLAGAEQRAYGWHHWFRKHAPEPLHPDQFTLAGDELGTEHGLAKLPYIRDTRRAIGLDGFILKFDDLTGPASQKTGTVFPDRIALGAYPVDIHALSGCDLPDHYKGKHDTLPFCIPFRALTHYKIENLLVAGKDNGPKFLGQFSHPPSPHRVVDRHSRRRRCRAHGKNRARQAARFTSRSANSKHSSNSTRPSTGRNLAESTRAPAIAIRNESAGGWNCGAGAEGLAAVARRHC